MFLKGYYTMYYIGIDLGGTNIAVGIVDENYKIVIKGSVPTRAERPGEEVIKDMAELCAKLVNDAGLTFDDIIYAGIASPGTVNPETGYIDYANNLNFKLFPIAEMLMSHIPLKKVYVENDANAAAKGEAVAGAAKGVKSAVMVTLGTGVGGGIIIDGNIYYGFNHAGGELGHFVIEYNGRPCTCGRKGCWEAYSSATGLINMTREKIEQCKESCRETLMHEIVENEGKVSGKTAFAAMKKGDTAGAEVVDMYINYLACGIANIITTFMPEVIVIGGGICHEGDNLLNPLNEKINRILYENSSLSRPVIKTAELGNDAGIIGAAVLGL